jgi:hypothetical protein
MVTPLLVSFVTVVTGVIVLAFWSQAARAQQDRRSTALGILHVTVAVTAVALWIVFVIGRADAIGRVSLGLLVTAAVAGVATLVSSRAGERTHRDIEAVPMVVLAVHAVLAAGTVAAVAAAFVSR